MEVAGAFLIVVTTSYLLGFTSLYLSNILMADLFPKPAVGTALGLMSCVGTGGAALFNLAAGPVIVRLGYAPIFILMACLHPAAAIVLQIFYRHGAGPASESPPPCPT